MVEWGEGMVEQLADAHLLVRIDRRDDDTRAVELIGRGGDWARAAGRSDRREGPAMQVLVLDTATPRSPPRRGGRRPGRRRRRRAQPGRGDRRRRGRTASCSPRTIAAALAEAGVRAGGWPPSWPGSAPGRSPGCGSAWSPPPRIGQALGIPTYGVCSLDGIGRRQRRRAPVLVATDARRREVYWAVYDDGVRVDRAGGRPPGRVAAELAAAGGGARGRRRARTLRRRARACRCRPSRATRTRRALAAAGRRPDPRRRAGRAADPALPAPPRRGRARDRPQAGAGR